jgi:hypothetical protein
MCLNFASAKIPVVVSSMEPKHRKKVWQELPDFTTVCFRVGNITNPPCNGILLLYRYDDLQPESSVFRKDKGELLDQPVLCNFITSPAVNAGVVKRQEPEKS